MQAVFILAAILLMAVGIWIYFLPWLEARHRKHPNAASIGILNLLLGWTFLGWVAALVWAFTNPQRAATSRADADSNGTQQPQPIGKITVSDKTKPCPFCAEDIKVEAIRCKHCGSDLAPVAVSE
jgi:thiol:disulfide interchange protein